MQCEARDHPTHMADRVAPAAGRPTAIRLGVVVAQGLVVPGGCCGSVDDVAVAVHRSVLAGGAPSAREDQLGAEVYGYAKAFVTEEQPAVVRRIREHGISEVQTCEYSVCDCSLEGQVPIKHKVGLKGLVECIFYNKQLSTRHSVVHDVCRLLAG